ncbi:MAG TPA: DedA family protein [Gemmatimonadaceae bacterium]|jgi:membrane protein DedA with SNARE-associated domain|nr:DedA family protein [Gemmatimonadaceae bacterium]
MDVAAFLSWVSALPLGALYLLLAAVALAENVFPPVPADTVVALGGFLAARGHGSLWAAFLAVWVANVAGAMAMYALGRRFGAEPLEQRLLGPKATRVHARLSDYYGRYGMAAVFLGRFIPGVRAFVPPFAGALRVPPLTAALLIGAASGIWYGTVCYAGYKLGADWAVVRQVLLRDGTTVAVVAAVLALLLFALWYSRRRSR